MTVASRPLAATAASNTPAYDLERVRADFPILARKVHGQRLAFLDSAASAQKPRAVIDAISHCYEAEYANVHRGVYWLSARATQGYEGARETVARFLNARMPPRSSSPATPPRPSISWPTAWAPATSRLATRS